MALRRFGFLALLFSCSLSAQGFPDASGLAERAIHVFSGTQNIEFTREISWQGEVRLLGAVNTVALFQGGNGKFRINFNNIPSPLLYVMDGEHLWVYRPVEREYLNIPRPSVDSLARGLISGNGDPGSPPGLASIPGGVVIRTEVIDVDGRPHDCWVTESRAPVSTVFLQFGRETRDVIQSTWYDKTLGLLLMKDLSAEMRADSSAAFAPVHMRLTTRGLKLDAPLDDSLFGFTPPQDATDEAVRLRGLGGSSGSRAPNMAAKLIKQVKPVYPALAKAARSEGTVKFVATIGKDGTVKELKVISGPPLLIDAAMDAVKQWVYKPTFVNGNPVEVLTTIDMNFALAPLVAAPKQ